jgi:hypothetical protein
VSGGCVRVEGMGGCGVEGRGGETGLTGQTDF